MELNEYQEQAGKTAMYPNKGSVQGLLYVVLGLCGESGELAEKCKKLLQDDAGVISEEKRIAMLKELGDVEWYCARIAAELNSNLNEVAQMNLDKTQDRYIRNVISGSGDER